MQNRLNVVFTRYEFLIPLFLFLFFLAASLPGISWGAPQLWNPDELIRRAYGALHGDLVFDVSEPDFNYPSLPKYVMYAIGSITYGVGRSDFAFFVAARAFSAFLGAVAGVLVYSLARMIGAKKRIAFLAGVLYIASGVAAANGRFAHNDLYLQFFTLLCVFFVVKYRFSGERRWLYGSFLAVGMAASSKYTGVSMVLLPLGVFLWLNWKMIWRNWLGLLGTLLLSAGLVIAGYSIGTPRLLLSPVDYLTNAVPAAFRFSQYGFGSGTPIGLYGQWAIFRDAVGVFAYYLFLLAFIWFVFRLILHGFGRQSMEEKVFAGVLILVANILLFDLPFLVSINYIPRHFIPFVPLFAVLGALFVDEVAAFGKDRNWKFIQPAVVAVLVVGLTYSLLRLLSIALLFLNDARIPATQYIATLRGFGKSIEYTLYPPNVEKRRFARSHNYPIYFVKYPNETVPQGGRYEFNQGEQGLLERETDYFVIDSLTYDRFYTDSVCATNPVECDFFKRLMSGEVTTYHLLAEFSYRLPPWLPPIEIAAVNPDVKIYGRVR
jgi:4-amino-4-deoxy-L-arabinose transferase-like glycosyltransferase